MALINCPECKKQISDKAQACPHCGYPIDKSPGNYQPNNYGLVCPRCESSNIIVNQKGFSGKKALAGAVAIGSLGVLAGTHGNNDLICNCVSCGHKFEPKQSVPTSDHDFWNNIDVRLKKGELSSACSYYSARTGLNTLETQHILEKRLRKLNPNAESIISYKNFSDTCLGVIVVLIILLVILTTCS